MSGTISHDDLQTLAAIRRELRTFLHFSEGEARRCGLTPQQHQAMLVIAGSSNRELTVGDLAEALLLKPHSASGLVSRLEALGMVERSGAEADARRRMIRLTGAGDARIAALSAAHQAEIRRLRAMLVKLLNAL